MARAFWSIGSELDQVSAKLTREKMKEGSSYVVACEMEGRERRGAVTGLSVLHSNENT